MTKLFVKLSAFICMLYGIFYLATAIVEKHDIRFDPRKALFQKNDLNTYDVALLGDSVFCSFYVDKPQQTICAGIEHSTGFKTLPGALDAARTGDFILAAEYLSANLRPGTTVFIDVLPHRYFGGIGTRQSVYNRDFFGVSGLSGEDNPFIKVVWNNIFHPLLSKLFFYRYSDWTNILLDSLSKRVFYKTDDDFDRRWDVNGNFASNSYKNFQLLYPKIRDNNFDGADLNHIVNILKKNNIKTVLVLVPVNIELIRTYDTKDKSREIETFILKKVDNIKNYLSTEHINYIDLTLEIPPKCFADLYHTNACGDQIVANNIAEYLGRQSLHD